MNIFSKLFNYIKDEFKPEIAPIYSNQHKEIRVTSLDDLPNPVNEDSDKLRRVLKKIEDIIKNIDLWEIVPNPSNYMNLFKTIKNNKYTIRIFYNEFYLKCEKGDYYCGKYRLIIYNNNNDDFIIDDIDNILDNYFLASNSKYIKYTKEHKLIRLLFDEFDKKKENEINKLRDEFYNS